MREAKFRMSRSSNTPYMFRLLLVYFVVYKKEKENYH